MPLTRDAVRASVERAGDDQWRALVRHHEDQYPASPPTPGDVCRDEAARLNELGLGTSSDFELDTSRVTRIGNEVELVHAFRYKPLGVLLFTEPFKNYGPLPQGTGE
jgi:hypothetical protein